MNNRTQQRPRPNQRRKPQVAKRPPVVEMWRKPDELPPAEPIAIPTDASALLRSLGDPPMNRASAMGHYFTTVVERAAAVAVALALSADMLADPDAG